MYRSLEEVQTLVRAFEESVLPAEDWNHASKLAVVAWYLSGYTEAEATERFISGLRRYTYEHGTVCQCERAYHETRTLFWLALARSFLRWHPDTPRLEAINQLVAAFGRREEVIHDFYRPETLTGEPACRAWVEPDRRPLEALDRLCRIPRARAGASPEPPSGVSR